MFGCDFEVEIAEMRYAKNIIPNYLTLSLRAGFRSCCDGGCCCDQMASTCGDLKLFIGDVKSVGLNENETQI